MQLYHSMSSGLAIQQQLVESASCLETAWLPRGNSRREKNVERYGSTGRDFRNFYIPFWM